MPDGSILNDASLIHDVFKDRIDMVIDGDIVSGKPSSVISLIDDTPEVIRKGMGDVSIFE
jgi:tRNA A37 threonylcarbamoyladenosine synthetase subunit TsaC/SUA5/YrdC